MKSLPCVQLSIRVLPYVVQDELQATFFAHGLREVSGLDDFVYHGAIHGLQAFLADIEARCDLE